MSNQTAGQVQAEVCNRDRLRRIKWRFTLYNYEDRIEWLKKVFILSCKYLIFGKEICPTTNKPHLQGYMELKSKRDKASLTKLIPGIWILDADAKREPNTVYCSKDLDYFEYEDKPKIPFRELLKQKVLKEEYNNDNITWKNWQKETIDRINEKPDNRKIYWYWEDKGNVGKTFLCKYIVTKYNGILCEGKSDNIMNQINKAIENEIEPKLVIIDSPRSHENFINYSAIEKLKNGLLYSGKYEGGICVFPHPHVFIYANHEPDLEKMSSDRWVIIKL